MRSLSCVRVLSTWRVVPHHALVDAEQVDAPGERVGAGLEHVGEELGVLVGLERAARRASSAPCLTGEGRSSTIASSRRLVPRLRVATPQTTGKMSPWLVPVLERGDDLLVGDLLALEVALHQRVGVLRDLVHELLAVLLRPASASSSGIGISRQLSRPSPSYS